MVDSLKQEKYPEMVHPTEYPLLLTEVSILLFRDGGQTLHNHEFAAHETLSNFQLTRVEVKSLWSEMYVGQHLQRATQILVEVLKKEWLPKSEVVHWWIQEKEQTRSLQTSPAEAPWLTILELNTPEGRSPFAVYHWTAGTTCFFEGKQSFAEEQAARLLLPLASALHHAHERELSVALCEEDLWLTANGASLLWKRSARSLPLQTEPQRLIRQPLLSPEELFSSAGFSEEVADFYSLGQVLHFLLTNTFHPNQKIFQPLPELSPAMNSVLSSLLEFVPERRLASLELLRQRLKPWMERTSGGEGSHSSTELVPVFFTEDKTPEGSSNAHHKESPTHNNNNALSGRDALLPPPPLFTERQPVEEQPLQEAAALAPPTLKIGGLDRSYQQKTLPSTTAVSPLELDTEHEARNVFASTSPPSIPDLRELDSLHPETTPEEQNFAELAAAKEEPPAPAEGTPTQSNSENFAIEAVSSEKLGRPAGESAEQTVSPILEAVSADELTTRGEETFVYEHAATTHSSVVKIHSFAQMNPSKNFPLRVEFWVPEEDGSGATDETLRIVPVFPGCIVQPPDGVVSLHPGQRALEFWLTPQATGSLENKARIQVWEDERLLQEFSTPCRVASKKATTLLASLSILTLGLWAAISSYGTSDVLKGIASGKEGPFVHTLLWMAKNMAAYGPWLSLLLFAFAGFALLHSKPRAADALEETLEWEPGKG